MVGLVGLEPTTPALSTRCSNQLSYRPALLPAVLLFLLHSTVDKCERLMHDLAIRADSRKEVIQPHLPVRLPCYDFTPVTSPTFDGSLPQGVRPPASGVACFRGVTGGVYKARERIHRGSADPRLLATPPSCRRVSACNPNRDAL